MSIMKEDVFEKLMNDMRDHYKSSSGRFIVPYKLEIKDDVLPEDTKVAVNDFQTDINGFNESQQKKITENTDKYLKDSDDDEFDRKMNEIRDKAKAESDEKIDKLVEKMKHQAKLHPESKPLIVHATNSILDFFTGTILDTLTSFVTNLIDQISKLLEKALQAVEDFFYNKATEVYHFFKGLFSALESQKELAAN
ncbi:MAG: hypothetical protein N3B21_11315 [Clostridia bacterium]|nr:hypothetical protein [Clostridia bacterium]